MEFIKVINIHAETIIINVDHIAVIREVFDGSGRDKRVELTLSVLDDKGKGRNERIVSLSNMRNVENALKPKPFDDLQIGGATQKATPKKTKKEAKEKK